MKFTCSKKDLESAIQTALRVISPRNAMDILECVLIDVDEDSLSVTATDGKMTSVTRIAANVETDGMVCLPGRLLGEVVRKLPDGDVSVSLSEKLIFTLKTPVSRTNISGRSADSFPRPAETEAVSTLSLPQPMLKDMISTVTFAIPAEDMRKVLTGGYLSVENGVVDLVGLDGFRMALRTERISDTEKKANAIIPLKALEEIAHMMGDNEDESVELVIGKNNITVKAGATSLYSVLIEGQYIDYRRIVPKSFNVKVKLKSDNFCASIDRTALMARDSKNSLIRMDVKENGVLLTSYSDRGDVYDEIDADVSGGEMNISFNVKYLSELIRVITGEEIVICLGTSITPCVISPAEGDSFTYMVLPVRTNA